MDIESLFIALLVVVVLALGYKLLRRRATHKDKDSAPEHFFGGVGEETIMTERGSPSELPSPREQPPAGQPRA